MEFALALPMMFVFILIVVDFGFALERREFVQHAVREGARLAAVESDVDAVASHTSEQSGGILSNIDVCYFDENDNGRGDAGENVQVSGEYTYNFMIDSESILGGVMPGIEMTPSSQARLEKTVFGASSC